jgi:predicted nucleic acid-binding protein
MRGNATRFVLADTGFWIALYDPQDEHHNSAVAIMDSLNGASFLFPWPLFYEVLRTRFVRRPGWVESFLTVLKAGRLQTVDDSQYRNQALEATLELAKRGARHLSLVDVVCRYVLDDRKLRISGLVTFNEKDFIDVCHPRGIRIFKSA